MRKLLFTFCASAFLSTTAFGQCVRFGDTVYLEVVNGDGHLSARDSHGEVRTDAPHRQGWEAFVVLNPYGAAQGTYVYDGDAVALWSAAHGTKLQGRSPVGASGDVYQTRNPIASWEIWTVETSGCASYGGGDIRLVSDHGTYLYSGGDGRARTDVTSFGTAARWKLHQAPDTAWICEEPLSAQGYGTYNAWDVWEYDVAGRHGSDWAVRANAADAAWYNADPYGLVQLVARPCLAP